MTEPTPDEAAAALRTVRDVRERAIVSAAEPGWLLVACGLVVFLYCAAIDLVPDARTWPWVVPVLLFVLIFGLRTRVGGALIGRSVAVSSRSLPLTLGWRLLRGSPMIAIVIAGAVLVRLLHVPHGQIYFGAVAALYIIFLDTRFQLWVLRRRDRDSSGG